MKTLAKQLYDKLELIRDECDRIRMTGIPSMISPEIEKMHIELNAQMILVKRIETILGEKK